MTQLHLQPPLFQSPIYTCALPTVLLSPWNLQTLHDDALQLMLFVQEPT